MMYGDYSTCIFLDMCDAFIQYQEKTARSQNLAIGTMRKLWKECLEQFHSTHIYTECLALVFKIYKADNAIQTTFKKDIERGYVR